MTEEEVRIESKREIYDSLPKLAVYVSIAILIYLFAILVFIPLGHGFDIAGVSTATAISVIAIIAILILLWRSSREIKDLCDAIGGLIAVNVGREGASDDEVAHYRKAVKGIVYVFAVIIAFLFIGSLLTEISGGFAGILLIVIFLWAVCTLYSAGMAISAEIESAANEVAQKLEMSAARKEDDY